MDRQHRYYIGRGPQADMLIAYCEAMKAERKLVIDEIHEKFAPGKVALRILTEIRKRDRG